MTNLANVNELQQGGMSLEAGVKMIACQMTVDLFGWKMDDYLPEVADWVGAVLFLAATKDADITLFI